MTRLGDLFLIPEWTASEREAVARLLSRIESIALDLGSRIDAQGNATELRAGSVSLGPAGLVITVGGVEKLRVDDAGLLLGNNLSTVIRFKASDGGASSTEGMQISSTASDFLALTNREPGKGINFTIYTTAGATPLLRWIEDPGLAERAQLNLAIAPQGTKLTIDGEVSIFGGVGGVETVFNEQGRDIDFRVEGDTVTDVFGVDAGLDAVTLGNYVRFDEITAPGTPAAGTVSVYAKSDGLLYSKDDAGAETLMSSGAGGDDSEFIAAPWFVNTFGSATSTNLASTQSGLNFRSFSMPDGSEVVLTTQWRIPPGVTGTITYKIYWAMDTTATGNVRWVVLLASVASGETLSAGSEETDALVTAASGVAKQLQVTTGTFTSAVAGGDLVGVIVNRQGAHATDTAAAAAHFLGIEFTW